MKIRPARSEDAPAIARVLVDTFLESNRGLMSEEAWQRRKQEWTYEVSARNWRETVEEIEQGASTRLCLFVAEDDAGEVVGLSYACPSKDENDAEDVGELDVLYVQTSHQRQGIGRALVQATAAHLAQVGVQKLHICTPENNIPGRVFYDRLGGRIIGKRDDYEDGELCVLVVYEWDDIHSLIGKSERGGKR